MKPQLKFKIDDEGYLLVSYDNGCTWENLGLVRGNASVVPGPQGETGQTGAPGNDGADGADGFSPYIDENTGEWVDKNGPTGVKAVGEYTDIEIGTDASTGIPGTPSVETEREGNVVTLKFKHLKGEKGDKGDTGATGQTGPQGEQGEQGDPGEGVHWKEQREDCAELNDAFIDSEGDMYVRVTPAIDEETQEEIPWDEAEYICYGNMRGPQGPQGPQGIQGPPMYFTKTIAYDSDEDAIILNVDAANPGDYLVYIGDDYAPADGVFVPSGEVFKRAEVLDDYDRQVWIDQEFTLRGPKGDVLNAEGIIPAFRLVENPGEGSSQLQVSFDNVVWTPIGNLPSKGIVSVAETDFSTSTRRVFRIDYTDGTYYDMVFDFTGIGEGSIYTAGNGIDISPATGGGSIIKTLIDNSTIKFDSEGRMYATGGGEEEYGAVLNFARTNTSSSSSYPEVRDITQQYFNINYDPVTGYGHLVYSPFTNSDLASKLLNGKIKKATIVVASNDASGGNYRAFLPASVLLSDDDSCLIVGWGFQSDLSYALGGYHSDGNNYQNMYASHFGGVSPALYCIHIKSDSSGYSYGGFIIETDSSVGIWGHT